MLQNPSAAQDDDAKAKAQPPKTAPAWPTMPSRNGQPLEPISLDQNAAINLIRQKVASIYAEEPDAKTELAEAEAAKPRSTHQQYMEGLQQSGKTMPEIQTAWHNYYVALTDKEKHEVWQEFYDAAAIINTAKHKASETKPEHIRTSESGVVVATHQAEPEPPTDKRTVADVKRSLLGTVQTHQRRQLKAKDHVKSLAFGLAAGFVVILIFLFSFFNEVIIAPFIQPSRTVGNIPLIINATTVSAVTTPEVIIPKINVEIPVDYTETSTDENVIENDLNNGVVHYPNTVLPGQTGNAAFFGHSSNNIFNPGKYKFAFVLLHTLVNGDTFYLVYNSKVYAYDVVDHKVVPPSDVSVLNDTEGNKATATLITCDPPGTSVNRLVVTGVQVSPDPSSNQAAPASPQVSALPAVLPNNGPSLWSRFVHWLF